MYDNSNLRYSRDALSDPAGCGRLARAFCSGYHSPRMCRPRVSASILREFERGTGNHNNERPIHPTDRQLRGKCAYFMVMHVALLHLFFVAKAPSCAGFLDCYACPDSLLTHTSGWFDFLFIYAILGSSS